MLSPSSCAMAYTDNQYLEHEDTTLALNPAMSHAIVLSERHYLPIIKQLVGSTHFELEIEKILQPQSR